MEREAARQREYLEKTVDRWGAPREHGRTGAGGAPRRAEPEPDTRLARGAARSSSCCKAVTCSIKSMYRAGARGTLPFVCAWC